MKTTGNKLRGAKASIILLDEVWELSEKDKLLNMLKSFNIGFKIYTDKCFISDKALKAGATESICIRDNVDIAFDKNGKVVGSYTDSINSYVSRKKAKNGR